MTVKYQWSFLFFLLDIGQILQQGLSTLPGIRRSAPDMSSVFRDHCSKILWAHSESLKELAKPIFKGGSLKGNPTFLHNFAPWVTSEIENFNMHMMGLILVFSILSNHCHIAVTFYPYVHLRVRECN